MKMITTTLEEITPDLARRYLAYNIQENRKISPSQVTKYAADMAAGNFMINNNAICFNEYGQLIDGQHRLQACVKAGVPFRSFVTRNLPADAYKVIDTGRPRDAKAALKYSHNGDPLYYSPDTVAVARAIYQWIPGKDHVNRRPSISEIEAFITDNHFLIEVASRLGRIKQKRVPASAVAGALMAYINGVPIEDIITFNAAAFASTVEQGKDPATTRIALEMHKEFDLGMLKSHSVNGFTYSLGVYQASLKAYLENGKRKPKPGIVYPAEIREGKLVPVKGRVVREGA